MFSIVPISGTYRTSVDRHVEVGWGGPYVVTKGVLHDTRKHPGFVEVIRGKIFGYILYNCVDGNCEITVLESFCENQGIGRLLVEAVINEAKSLGCNSVWLITTNDNTRAIRFYQRLGFALQAVHIGAIEESRKLKPQIPLIGYDGIPILHEFEFKIPC